MGFSGSGATRLGYVALVSLLTVLAGSGCSAPKDISAPVDESQSVNEAMQPNVVLIIADDLGWGDVGYQGSEIRTPTLDKMAAEGLRLERFYTYPACTPARGAILSGQRMRTVGLVEPIPPWSDAGLPLEITTLPEALKDAGYATWKVGKWHLGDHYLEQFPNQRGFDHFYGFLSGEVNYYTHKFTGALDWQRNGSPLEEEGYATHLLTAEAVSLLQSHPTDAPFFLDLSYNAPHTPLQAPQAAVAEYGHIENHNRQRYAAMVTEMDKGIREVLAAVRARPDAARTLVLFLSDNGGMPPFGGSNKPLRGGKANHLEGGIRVPAIAWWPEVLASGKRDQFMSVHDVFPTLLSLAGGQVSAEPALVGADFWPNLVNDKPVERTEPIVFSLMLPGPPGKPTVYSTSIIHDGLKLIETLHYDRREPDPGARYEIKKQELFDVLSDPTEQLDLAAADPSKVEKLAAMLGTVPRGVPIGFKPPPPDWSLPLMPQAEANENEPPRTELTAAAAERSRTLAE